MRRSLAVAALLAPLTACAAPEPIAPQGARAEPPVGGRARTPAVAEQAPPSDAERAALVDEAAARERAVVVTDEQYAAFEAEARAEYADAPEPEVAPDGVPVAERAVVVLNDSTTGSSNPPTYRMIDAGMKLLFDLGLRKQYGKVAYFGEGEATSQAFFDAVGAAAKDPGVATVDAIVNLHGAPGELGFVGGNVTTQGITDGLTRAVPDAVFHKLRVVYNQACFGDSHSAGFVNGGFFAAAGPRGLHTTGIVDWPRFVRAWRGGETFAASLRPAGVGGGVVKRIAEWFTGGGNPDVDNTWVLVGPGEDLAVYTRLVKQ